MTDLDRKQMQALDAQIALQLKQAQTEFWKIGIGIALAGAALGSMVTAIVLGAS